MALVLSDKYPGQIDVTDPTGYPQGKAQNQISEGDGRGTPWEQDLVNDFLGFLQSLLAAGRTTPSGTPDKVGASDYLNALKKLLQPLAVLTWDQPKLIGQNDLPIDAVSNKAVTISPDINDFLPDKLIASPDGGNTWAPVTIANPTGVVMLCGAMDPNGTKGIFTGSKAGGTDIQISVALGSYPLPLGGFQPVTPPGTPIDLKCALFDATTSRFIVTGRTATAPYIATSELADPGTWTQRTVPASITGVKEALSLVQLGTTIVATWEDQAKIAYSTDGGLTWTASSTSLITGSHRVVAGETKFVALSSSTPTVYNSSDGIVWTHQADLVRTPGPQLERWGFKFIGGVYIARGPSGTSYYYSLDDGVTWVEVPEQNRQFLSFCIVRNRLLQFRYVTNGSDVDVYMERSLPIALPG